MRRRSGLSSTPIEFLTGRFYLVVVRERTPCSAQRGKGHNSSTTPASDYRFFPRTPGIDFIPLQGQILTCTPNTSDVPLGIPQTIRFNAFLTSVLVSSPPYSDNTTTPLASQGIAGSSCRKVHYFVLRRRHLQEEIQVIHLICRWRLLYLQLSPREALAPFEHLPYLFAPFFSLSATFDSPNILGSLAGIAKALEKKLFGSTTTATESSTSTVTASWNAIVSRSHDEPNLTAISQRFIVYDDSGGAHAVDDVGQTCGDLKHEHQQVEFEKTIAALKRRKVALVLILNHKHRERDASVFAEHGLEALDILSVPAPAPAPPSDKVLVNRFLEACERTEGIIAIGTSSSPDRAVAATCIGCYLMKHHKFTSQEAFGWLRVCLPGKIPIAKEIFLAQMQSPMWKVGERFRRTRDGDNLDEVCNTPTSDSMHINIGRISLGRLSLLGTRDRDKHHNDSNLPSTRVHTCISSRSQDSQQSPTASTTTAQLKRRPLTQGSVGSRRLHRTSDGASLRADFALMHKFLHQTPSNSSRGSPPGSASGSVPSRPKASSRSSDGTSVNCTEALA